MRFVLLTAVAAAAIALAAPAGASGPHHGLTKHDRDVIRFFQHHPRAAATPAGGRVLSHVLPHVVHELRALQAARAARVAAAAALPAHLALWRCIAGYPGARPGGGSGESGGNPAASNGSHFNVLQMTDPWEGIHPIGMDPMDIMWAAERGYAANGFSSSWLTQQWGQTVGPCWGYA